MSLRLLLTLIGALILLLLPAPLLMLIMGLLAVYAGMAKVSDVKEPWFSEIWDELMGKK